MTASTERQVVGSYPTRDQAELAQRHLHEHDLSDVTIRELDAGVFAVEVPAVHRQRALNELERMEQWIAESH